MWLHVAKAKLHTNSGELWFEGGKNYRKMRQVIDA